MATTSITTALGVGSGVNISELVSSLVDAQYANKTARLTQKTDTITKQISGVASVKSGITGFASALSALVKGGSLGTAPTSSNPSIVTATALSGAKLAGMSSTIEVQQLAQSQVATSTIKKDGISSIGLGSFTLTFGTATVTNGAMSKFDPDSTATPTVIAITEGNSGLSGIARAINASGAGVTATVLTDADGSRLSIKGPTGEAKAFTLIATETAPAAGDTTTPGLATLNIGPPIDGQPASTTRIGSAAQDAIVAVDGTPLKRAGNSITDLIPGVKLDLVSASVGTKVTLGTSAPTSALNQAVSDFVETFNQLSAVLKEQTDPVTGTLRSDSATNALQRSLRNLTLTPLITNGAAGTPTTLAEIGVKTNRDGTLSVDTPTLTAALMKYPAIVEAMFADGKGATGNGISAALSAISDAAINTTTGLGASTTRYTKAQQAVSDDQADITAAAAVATTRMTAQFAAMDARVAAYKSTLTFLTQQIDAWNSND